MGREARCMTNPGFTCRLNCSNLDVARQATDILSQESYDDYRRVQRAADAGVSDAVEFREGLEFPAGHKAYGPFCRRLNP